LTGSLLLGLPLMLFSPPAGAVAIDWVTVGDPGNACDSQSQGCFGAVGYTYRIAKYEVTNAQYTEFLNAVADADPKALYSADMGSGFGGITRSGSDGSYMYSAIVGREDLPVNQVSFWDGLRFANWLHNGQPSGAQSNATTEDGAYTLTASGIASNTIARNSGAAFFVTSEDEWYKAAYYDSASASYFDYPTGTNTTTVCAAPGATPNTASCDAAGSDGADADVDDLTIIGSFSGSASPYGTFDQGGNVHEWNEGISQITERVRRGGGFSNPVGPLQASARSASTTGPDEEAINFGFRVASVPEPGAGLLFASGVFGLSILRRLRR
jgi:formylglycine-generating enzyme required for sulfatase activity